MADCARHTKIREVFRGRTRPAPVQQAEIKPNRRLPDQFAPAQPAPMPCRRRLRSSAANTKRIRGVTGRSGLVQPWARPEVRILTSAAPFIVRVLFQFRVVQSPSRWWLLFAMCMFENSLMMLDDRSSRDPGRRRGGEPLRRTGLDLPRGVGRSRASWSVAAGRREPAAGGAGIGGGGGGTRAY